MRGGEGLDDYIFFRTRGDTADAKEVEELGAVVEKLAVGEAGGSISNCSPEEQADRTAGNHPRSWQKHFDNMAKPIGRLPILSELYP